MLTGAVVADVDMVHVTDAIRRGDENGARTHVACMLPLSLMPLERSGTAAEKASCRPISVVEEISGSGGTVCESKAAR